MQLWGAARGANVALEHRMQLWSASRGANVALEHRMQLWSASRGANVALEHRMQLWSASRGANVALEHRMQQLERLSRRECGFGTSLREPRITVSCSQEFCKQFQVMSLSLQDSETMVSLVTGKHCRAYNKNIE